MQIIAIAFVTVVAFGLSTAIWNQVRPPRQ